jgi:hypothetical protein
MVAPSPERLMESLREALIHRGAAVAVTDGYEPYDLELRIPPLLHVPILILQQQWELGVGWRVRLPPLTIGLAISVIFLVLLLVSFNPLGALAGTIVLAALAGLLIWQRLRKLPALIGAAVADAARHYGLRVAADGA